MTMVLTRLAGEPVLQPSNRQRRSLEFSRGKLQGLGDLGLRVIPEVREIEVLVVGFASGVESDG